MPDPRESTAPAPPQADDGDHHTETWFVPPNDAPPQRGGSDQLGFFGEEASGGIARLRDELVESQRGLARFENLFRIAPLPLIEQDYTMVEEWMDELRRQGVEDIIGYLGGDPLEAVRAVAPMIRIVAANPAALKAVGMTLDQFIGPIDPSIVNEGALPSWLAQLEAVWKRQPVAHASFVAETLEGGTFDAESTLAAPVIDGEPDFSRAVFTLIDVSTHRNEERRMRELVEAKSQFVAWVSHEIRTPLTGVLGFAQILEWREDISEEGRRMISAIIQQAQEVSDIVDDLLVATRVELGRIDVVSVPTDTVEQIAQTMELGGSYSAGVEVELIGGDLEALGDGARIRQILRNLLTNAERYGGSDVRITATSRDDLVCIEVSDDGPGLPGSDWDRIFEPYQRSTQSPQRAESVGIGLSISRQLAELMHGSLSYERVGNRSVFRLVLPRASA